MRFYYDHFPSEAIISHMIFRAKITQIFGLYLCMLKKQKAMMK